MLYSIYLILESNAAAMCIIGQPNSMQPRQPLQHVLLGIDDAVILTAAPDTHALSILDHEQEYRRGSHADKRGGDEAVLVAEVS